MVCTLHKDASYITFRFFMVVFTVAGIHRVLYHTYWFKITNSCFHDDNSFIICFVLQLRINVLVTVISLVENNKANKVLIIPKSRFSTSSDFSLDMALLL